MLTGALLQKLFGEKNTNKEYIIGALLQKLVGEKNTNSKLFIIAQRTGAASFFGQFMPPLKTIHIIPKKI